MAPLPPSLDPSKYVDNGATNHVTAYMESLVLINPYHGNEKVMVGNGKCLAITHIGLSTLPTAN